VIPLPWLSSIPWRLVGWGALVAAVALAGWRVSAWHRGYQEADALREQLAAEVACEPASTCARRTEALAAQARREAEERAQGALEVAQQAEAQARADAAAWRKRYEAARVNDPDCAAWTRQAIACPIN